MDNDAVIAEFCSITDQNFDTARDFLAAHDWQLEAALNTFFHDPAPPAFAGAGAARVPLAEVATAAAGGREDDYVEILDDEDDAGGAGLAELARQRASALAAQQQAQDEHMEVEEAAAAGGSGGGSPQQQAAQHLPPVGFDAADDDLAAIAAAAAADGMGPADDVASYHRRQQEELLAMYQRQAARQQGMVAATAAAHGPAAAAAEEHLEGGLSAEQEGLAVAGAGLGGAAAAAGVAGFVEEEPLDLPAGINLEEARMLEAAMLGIPYAGRIPDFSAAPAAAAPRSPGALEQQSIRQEQDQAYEESLALDRAKQESLAAAAAEVEAAERAQRVAEEAAAAEAARAAADLQQLLAAKASRLPAEPGSGTAGSLQVVVRLPTGSRKGRRFLPTDPLQAVFDFVDVECAAAGGQGEAEGSCGIKPGSYRLVTQFPRKVFAEDGSSTLQDAGITADTALFIEPK